MIIRTVLVKLKDEWSTPEGRSAVAQYSQGALAAIPGVAGARALLPADAASSANWDVLLEVQFHHLDDVEPYRVHPLHVAYLDEYLNPRAAVKKAWNWAP